MNLTRLAWREIRNHPRFSLFFIFNLSLGLFGFLSLDMFQRSFSEALQHRSKALLGADLSVSVRRPFTEEEERILKGALPQGSETLPLIEMYTMVVGPKGNRLVQVRAVGGPYPYYGELEVSTAGASASKRGSDLGADGAWAYPELLPQLGWTEGDTFTLGGRPLTLRGVVLKDSTNAWASTSLAPRLFVPLEWIASTNLLQVGSTAHHGRIVKLPPGWEAEQVVPTLEKAFTDPGVQVWTHRTTSEAVGRMLGYLGDYLGLVALVAVFLAAVGCGFLFRTYLVRRSADIATLRALGLRPNQAQGVYLWQLSFLGVGAAVPALAAAGWGLPLMGRLARELVPLDLGLQFSAATLPLALGLGVGVPLALCLPVLARIRSIAPWTLLRDSDGADAPPRPSLRPWIPAVLGFWALAVLQSRSWVVGSLFWGGFLITLGLLGGSAALALRSLRRASGRLSRWPLGLRMAGRALERQPLATTVLFLAVGLSLFLTNLIPQLETSLQSELEAPGGQRAPTFFLFDIQDDQGEPLLQFVRDAGATPGELSPFIRARIDTVNGAPFAKGSVNERTFSREEERENRFRNRGFNLTYRLGLTPSETLVEGESLTEPYDPSQGLPGVSVEVRFSERLGFKLGDRLQFDIQGVPVEGVVRNLRKVRWTSFQPNFFIQFQPGVLEDAPKTYLLAVSGIAPEATGEFSGKLVDQFPNVSLIEVGRVVARIREIMDQMSWALRAMAWLSLLSGAVVLFAIVSHQAQSRRKEVNLLKVVGAKRGLLFHMVGTEFLLVAAFAGALGAAGSVAFSFLIAHFLFDGIWAWKLAPLVVSWAGTLGGGLALVLAATGRVVGEKPAVLFQEA